MTKETTNPPKKALIWSGWIFTGILIIAGIFINLLPDWWKDSQYIFFSSAFITALITSTYQNTEKRLDDAENNLEKQLNNAENNLANQLKDMKDLVKSTTGVYCRVVPPTTSMKDDVTVEQLVLENKGGQILLMYLGVTKPSNIYLDQFSEILSHVKRTKGLILKHVMLATPDTLDWIEFQIKEMQNINDFNLACFWGKDSQHVHNIGISIQVFNEYKILIVDPAKKIHSKERDVYLKSNQLGPLFAQYHSRVYAEATEIVRQGAIVKHNYNKLNSAMSQTRNF